MRIHRPTVLAAVLTLSATMTLAAPQEAPKTDTAANPETTGQAAPAAKTETAAQAPAAAPATTGQPAEAGAKKPAAPPTKAEIAKQRAQRQRDARYSRLNLSDAQKKQIDAIETAFNEENRGLMKEIRELRSSLRTAKQGGDEAKLKAINVDLEKKRAEMQAAQGERDKKIGALLTEEQYKAWQLIYRSHMQRNKPGR